MNNTTLIETNKKITNIKMELRTLERKIVREFSKFDADLTELQLDVLQLREKEPSETWPGLPPFAESNPASSQKKPLVLESHQGTCGTSQTVKVESQEKAWSDKNYVSGVQSMPTDVQDPLGH